MSDTQELSGRLAAFFDPSEVKFKPQAVSGNRALAIAYVDARVVMDRLDDVMGCDGWEDAYETLADGSVRCRLTLHFPTRTVTKSDVGGESEQPDEGDKCKAAHSDALKRTAVKFGVARYLYRLPRQWCDYDPQKKQFTRTPTLPAEVVAAVQRKPKAPKSRAGEMDGAALEQKLLEWGDLAIKDQLTTDRELILRTVRVQGMNAGYPPELNNWGPRQCEQGLDWGRKAGASLRKQKEAKAG